MGGIKDIQIITDSRSLNIFKKIIFKLKLKTKFSFKVQNHKPIGIVDGIIKSKKFIKDSTLLLSWVIIFFMVKSLSNRIQDLIKKKKIQLFFLKKKSKKIRCLPKIKNNKLIVFIKKMKRFSK